MWGCRDWQEPVGYINVYRCKYTLASQVLLVAENSPANAADTKKCGSVPELGRSPGGWHDNHPPVFLPGGWLSFPPPEELPDQGIEPMSPASPALAG